eukprot:6090392-Amphidinium_carterae.1
MKINISRLTIVNEQGQIVPDHISDWRGDTPTSTTSLDPGSSTRHPSRRPHRPLDVPARSCRPQGQKRKNRKRDE